MASLANRKACAVGPSRSCAGDQHAVAGRVSGDAADNAIRARYRTAIGNGYAVACVGVVRNAELPGQEQRRAGPGDPRAVVGGAGAVAEHQGIRRDRAAVGNDQTVAVATVADTETAAALHHTTVVDNQTVAVAEEADKETTTIGPRRVGPRDKDTVVRGVLSDCREAALYRAAVADDQAVAVANGADTELAAASHHTTVVDNQTVAVATGADMELVAVSPLRTRPSDQHAVVGGVRVIADVAVVIRHPAAVGDDQAVAAAGIADREVHAELVPATTTLLLFAALPRLPMNPSLLCTAPPSLMIKLLPAPR